MFAKMSIGKKIVLGFSSVLALLIVVGVIGYNGLDFSRQGLQEYRRTAINTNLLDRLQANMLTARMNVKDFLITHSEGERQQFEEDLKKARSFIEEAHRLILEPENAAIVDAIDSNLQTYQSAFYEAADLTIKRS